MRSYNWSECWWIQNKFFKKHTHDEYQKRRKQRLQTETNSHIIHWEEQGNPQFYAYMRTRNRAKQKNLHIWTTVLDQNIEQKKREKNVIFRIERTVQ